MLLNAAGDAVSDFMGYIPAKLNFSGDQYLAFTKKYIYIKKK